MSNRNKIIVLIGVFITIISFAVLGYMLILDLAFIDALYMTVITISTVGYTEVAEMTQPAKVFSVFVIVTSVGTVGYIVSNIIRYFSEGMVNEAWRLKRMEKNIEQLNNHVIVCGAGETGRYIIKEFQLYQRDFVVIESNETIARELQNDNVLCIHDDATHEDVLEEAGIERAKALITTLAKDADNVFVVLTAREMNRNLHIVARAHEESSYKKLKRAGANNTVSPNEIGGKKMAAMIVKPYLAHFMDHIIDTGNISINLEEVIIQEQAAICHKTLKDAKVSEKTGLIVLAIRKPDSHEFIFNPKADYVLKPKDFMIVVGEKDQIDKLSALAQN